MYNRLTLAGSGGKEKAPVTITNKTRTDWNNYVDWLEKKALKGSALLDKDGFGFKMIEQYKKENPETTITKDAVVPIQKEFQKYRQYALDQVDKGKVILGDGVTKDNFLRALSIVDGIPGQRTTSYKFPEGFMKEMDTTENKGFMNTDSPAIQQLLTQK